MISTQVQDKVFGISGSFQYDTSYDSVIGNHDGMLFSAGILQWSIGMATLQPLLKDIAKRAPTLFASHLGAPRAVRFLALANGHASWRDSAYEFTGAPLTTRTRNLLPEWKAGISAIMGSEIGIQVQRDAMSPMLDQAWKWCEEYELQIERGLSLFLDIRVQNGTIEPQTRARILHRFVPGMPDAKKLEIVAEERVAAVLGRSRGEFLSRKMCIVNGTGEVRGRQYDLEKEFGLTDAPVLSA